MYDGLKCLDLLVVADHFMTPTAEMADYVLPAAYWTEVKQLQGYPLVAENLVYHQQAVVHTDHCRQDEWIMDELTQKIETAFLRGDPGRCNENTAGTSWHWTSGAEDQKSSWQPHQYKKYLYKGFRTPSRKIELYSKALERLGYDPLPSYQEPPESPVSRPDLALEYPYVLTTGSRRKEFFHSEQRQIASLRKRRPHPQAELHPDVAESHQIKTGDWIIVSSPRGCARMQALVTEDIRSDVVNVDHGWWFPEKAGPEHGVWESNANLLTCNEPPYDPAFGTYQLRGLLCSIEKESQA